MKFRVARHTNDLEKIEQFYTTIIGLKILGRFKNHNNYNGIFLGIEGLDWHLEFTTSLEEANHNFNEDDILVFYTKTTDEFLSFKNRIEQEKITIEIPKNPYWQENGIQISDPDGYKIILQTKKTAN